MRPRLHCIELIQDSTDRSRDPDLHDWHELVSVIDGRYRVEIEGRRLETGPGTVFCFPRGTLHAPRLPAHLHVRLYVLQWHDGREGYGPDRQLMVDDRRGRLHYLVDWLWQLRDATGAADRGFAGRILGMALAQHARLSAGGGEGETGDPAVDTVLTCMRADLHRALDLPELARAAGLSVTGLIRRFKRVLGTTPGKHLQRLRVETAVGLFRTTRLTRRQVAERVGLRSPSHLNRLVKELTGRTPGDLRG